MSSRAWDVQVAIHDALVTALGTVPVLDHVPQGTAMPYVVVGEMSMIPFDTCSTTGDELMVTIHTWSSYRGRKETRDLQATIYGALHRSSLDGLAGLIDCEIDMAQDFLDPDGLTRHGVQRVRIQIEGE